MSQYLFFFANMLLTTNVFQENLTLYAPNRRVQVLTGTLHVWSSFCWLLLCHGQTLFNFNGVHSFCQTKVIIIMVWKLHFDLASKLVAGSITERSGLTETTHSAANTGYEATPQLCAGLSVERVVLKLWFTTQKKSWRVHQNFFLLTDRCVCIFGTVPSECQQ